MSTAVRLALVALTDPEGVVTARRVAREAAAALGFPKQDQTRIATAVSELARNAFQYARGGRLVIELAEGSPQLLVCRAEDDGPGIIDLQAVLRRRSRPHESGHGLLGVQRLGDDFDLVSGPSGTVATFVKRLPQPVETDGAALRQQLRRRIAADAQEELEHQNRELLQALSALRARQEELVALNQELDDTNRGVVALHHELDQQAARDRTISRMLQRSLMPDRLASAPGVVIHAAHRSAGEGNLVGGDFYDVIDVGRDELWLVMGDVAGHGVETAAKANELRQTLRVYAREGYRPEQAFDRLNELVRADDLVGLATACLILLNPLELTAETLIAGHPPPVLIPGDGRGPELLEVARGPVIGIPDVSWGVHRHQLAPGDRLVLYTDGLVERVGETLTDSFERLLDTVRGIAEDGPAVLDRLFELPEEPLRDDVAVLTARLQPGDAEPGR